MGVGDSDWGVEEITKAKARDNLIYVFQWSSYSKGEEAHTHNFRKMESFLSTENLTPADTAMPGHQAHTG